MRVLLVDHDSEALETVTRAIRGVLELDCVTSKGDALLLLRQNTYDVLIACERAIDGSGLDLLGRTTRTAVPLKRIFAAAPERLQLLGPRLAPFKVQRTINYPIDLEELWLAIAQVTSGPDDETDGTIERVVLDERGIPANGSLPRAPIPPRPPAPLASRPAAPAAVAVASTSASGRHAAMRVTQPAPEPPLRAPPAPRTAPAAATSRRATPARAPMTPPAAIPEPFPAWTPEPAQDDFAEIAAQARFGVQQKAVDEAARRKRQRVIAACGIAVVVAGAIVLLIEKFYDPEARARDRAIAAEVARMAEQQKVTDDLTLIEIDIENAIMNDDLDRARRELATLIEKAPDHPRREFLQASIDRAAALARLSPQARGEGKGSAERGTQEPVQAAVLPGERASARPRDAERLTERVPERVPERAPERVARTAERAPASRPAADANGTRSFGAPISEAPHREPVIPLDAPIYAPPTYSARRTDNSFSGRTVEASDSGVARSAPPVSPPAPTSVVQAPANASGSAATPAPGAAPATAPKPPAPVDVVAAKLVKRVLPVAPSGLSRKTSGHVVVTYNIGVDGRVSDVEVVESEPQGVFDESALEAVRKWVYEPRRENGVAVVQPGKARLVFDNSAN